MQKLKEIWTSWTLTGVHLPFLYDPTSDKPSITLGLLYLTSVLMLGSVLALHIKDNLLVATLVSILVWVLSYVFYKLRKLDKAKFDLDDKSFELSGNSDEKEE
jgi:hypothetical protein